MTPTTPALTHTTVAVALREVSPMTEPTIAELVRRLDERTPRG